MSIREATHAYIGIDQCGCTIAAVVDMPEHRRDTAKAVYQWLLEGLAMTRVTLDDVRMLFQTCPHAKTLAPIPGIRLYEVHLLVTSYTLATSDDEAIEVAKDAHRHLDLDCDGDYVAFPAQNIHPDWHDEYPYADADHARTCGEILEAQHAADAAYQAAQPDPRQISLEGV